MTQTEFDSAMQEVMRHREAGHEHYNAQQLTPAQQEWEHSAALLIAVLEAIHEDASPESMQVLLTILAQILNNIGFVYRAQGKLPEALEKYQAAYEIDHSIEPRSTETATRLNNIGSVYQAQGKLPEALEKFQVAYEINHSIEPRSTETATCLSNIGSVYQAQGKLPEALEKYQAAYEINHSIEPRSTETATRLNNIGSVYQAQGKLPEALEKYQAAYEIDHSIEPRSTQTATRLNNIGGVYQAQGRLPEALEKFQETVALVEGLRRTAGGFRGADAILSEYGGAYLGWIDVLFARHDPDDPAAAFHVAERFRARTLAERMTERAVRPAAQNPQQETLLARADALRFALASALDQTASARLSGDETALTHATRQVQQIESAQEVNEAELRLAFPEYAELAYPEPVTLEEAQLSLLDPGALLLSFLQSGSDLYLWAVRQTDYRMLLLPIDPATLNSDLVKAVGRFHGISTPSEETGPALARLSQALLGSIPAVLWAGVTRLLIVPSSQLNFLPFEMLLRTGEPGDMDGCEAMPLGVTYEISYAPSATILRTLRILWDRRPAPDWKREFLGIGDPDVHGGEKRSGIRAGTGRLPGTRYEVEEIAQKFGASALPCLGAEATEWNAFAEAPGTRFIQFATHGLFDGDEPLNSFLLLSPPQAQDPPGHDSRLCVHEMFGLSLNAEMVACSACVTGLSQERAGEGIVGMNTALLTAGAKCVLTTLWPVNDASVAEFMIVLYEHLRQGMPVGKALKETRSHMYASYRDAYHWAPVIATGLT